MIDIKAEISRYDGILPQHIAFYSESIRFNVESAANSISIVGSFIHEYDAAKGDLSKIDFDQNTILDNLQNILGHASAISRYFWPSKDGEHKLHKKRAQYLKKIFKITESNPLRNRDLRNQLEHFDENLDKYLWSKPIVGHILPGFIGDTPRNEQVPYHLFRAFFVDTCVFETLGAQYELNPIVDEIGKLYEHFHPDSERT